ncbi:Nuclear control of ATPase protein 2 [Serendipita sp. 411]|nr:Nuclear control of ATPase protein 2 [Serendipita sp. 411]
MSFVNQRTREIFQTASTDVTDSSLVIGRDEQNSAQRALRKTLAGLNTPPTDQQLFQGLDALDDNASDGRDTVSISGRVTAALYGRAMDELLRQSLEADDEIHYWLEVERSRYRTMRFLLQTFPLRIQRLTTTFVSSLRHRNIPLTLSTLRVGSIRRLFPTTQHPSELLVAAFPHLGIHHPSFFPDSPLSLTRDECRLRRKNLEAIRNDRALRLGLLAMASHDLEYSLSHTCSQTEIDQHTQLLRLALNVHQGVAGGVSSPKPQRKVFDELDECKLIHNEDMSLLRRPSWIVRSWPRLLLVPPATYLFLRYVYNSRESVKQHVHDAVETMRSFWQSWVLEPIRGIILTVRTGGDDGLRVISKDALKADMESLERMTFDLGKEKLGFTQAQLDAIHDQIQQGDLSSVLRVYEEDIKSPIRSAMTGTLIRSLLIQVQKVKVDVDFALSGIDKLLRSQELTFGFVGVAPALAVVYLSFGWLIDFWRGGRGRGKFGGKRQRRRVWNGMRRIEKLLISPPTPEDTSSQYLALFSIFTAISDPGARKMVSNRAHEAESLQAGVVIDHDGMGGGSTLSPLTNGLLLLSSTQLRTFAEAYLRSSNFRDEFLEDVRDLEDSRLSVGQKRLVLERMWRSWGRMLGWDNLAEV